MNPSKKDSSIRTPAVAGKFYPENPSELETKVASHLGNLSKKKETSIAKPNSVAHQFEYSL